MGVLVSCIIPTYKRNKTLSDAIYSILNQSYKELEVLVVDDNEPNDEYSLQVQKIVNEINDKRLSYIQQEKHINGAAARNCGILHSKGEMIAFLDDDDVWLPIKLEKQVLLLNSLGNEYGAVSCLATFKNNGNVIRKTNMYSEKDLHKKVLERKVSIYTCTILFKRKALIKTGVFDERLNRHQDLQLFLDHLLKYKIKLLPEHLVIINTDVGGNRPSGSDLIAIKENFFDIMKKHFNKYEDRTIKRIKAAHYFEVILVFLREKEFISAVQMLSRIGMNPMAYYDLFLRFYSRIRKN